MILVQVEVYTSDGVRHKYAIVFRNQFMITCDYQDKNLCRFCYIDC